jgi:excisionase family DNA binding protein
MNKKLELIMGKIAYSLEEASEMLGVSKGHLRNENTRGKLKFLRSGRRILITSVEIHRYLESLSADNTEITSSNYSEGEFYEITTF